MVSYISRCIGLFSREVFQPSKAGWQDVRERVLPVYDGRSSWQISPSEAET